MTIAGASSSLITLRQREFAERHGGLGEYTFKVLSSSEIKTGITKHVTLYLYRVHVDPTRRHIDIPSTEMREPSRFALGLELRYLLTVWGGDAVAEHQILGECMEILDEHAIVSGALLDPAYPWEDGDALKLSIEPLANEDMMRLWDSLEPTYQLSVPYLVRTVRLRPVERPGAILVESQSTIWTPAVPS